MPPRGHCPQGQAASPSGAASLLSFASVSRRSGHGLTLFPDPSLVLFVFHHICRSLPLALLPSPVACRHQASTPRSWNSFLQDTSPPGGVEAGLRDCPLHRSRPASSVFWRALTRLVNIWSPLMVHQLAVLCFPWPAALRFSRCLPHVSVFGRVTDSSPQIAPFFSSLPLWDTCRASCWVWQAATPDELQVGSPPPEFLISSLSGPCSSLVHAALDSFAASDHCWPVPYRIPKKAAGS